MIVVERTLAVAAAPAPALAYLTDFANTAAWGPAVRQTTRNGAGPIVPGSSWHQVCRILGITTELTYTLVLAEPGRLVFQGRTEGATCLDEVTVRPAGTGSEVTYRVELEMHGLAKLATPVIKMELEKLGAAGAHDTMDDAVTQRRIGRPPRQDPPAAGDGAGTIHAGEVALVDVQLDVGPMPGRPGVRVVGVEEPEDVGAKDIVELFPAEIGERARTEVLAGRRDDAVHSPIFVERGIDH